MTCIRYREGSYKYQLRAPYVHKTGITPDQRIETEWLTLDVDGTLTIRAGYAWDGASGPTYDSKSSMRASLVHDAIFQLCRLRLLDADKWRKTADEMFHAICVQDGMLAPRAWLWYHAVRIFAKPAATSAESPDETAGCGCLAE